ncbi:hypothetical protein AYO37_01005 [Opitutia bacterium SCGC AG-212-L18]|nr:hypothetical protein AYO37_01005 [Opitutae bacterium SCGC AG-212-L18]
MKYKSILMGQFSSIFGVAPGVHRENSRKLGLKRVCNSLFLLIPNSGLHENLKYQLKFSYRIKKEPP